MMKLFTILLFTIVANNALEMSSAMYTTVYLQNVS